MDEYEGLPPEIKKNVYEVERWYRTNPLSFVEGGYDIVIVYENGKCLLYDWIKMPSRYIKVVLENRDSKMLSIYLRDDLDKTNQEFYFHQPRFVLIWNKDDEVNPRDLFDEIFNIEELEIRNVRIMKIFDPTDRGKSGQGKGKFKHPPRPNINQDTKRLEDTLRMEGVTNWKNKKNIKIRFWIDEYTFDHDISLPYHLFQDGIYALENPRFYEKGNIIQGGDYDKFKEDTIIAGPAVFKGEKVAYT